MPQEYYALNLVKLGKVPPFCLSPYLAYPVANVALQWTDHQSVLADFDRGPQPMVLEPHFRPDLVGLRESINVW